MESNLPCQARRDDTNAAPSAGTPGLMQSMQTLCCTSGPRQPTATSACASHWAGACRQEAARSQRMRVVPVPTRACKRLWGWTPPTLPTGAQCRPGRRYAPILTNSELKLPNQRTGMAEIEH